MIYNIKKDDETQSKDTILFVGNDGNRDAELFLKIVDNLKKK